ncbi:unnamed protein product [Cyclocybe aegerita]|uniref:CHAT domain-containing protein n=1 Tax=Cyclocybe aegerita TaxID=1973307 RepID=A0A8S0WTF5_CYCAE|nr:unnamed protein product [Cyclocybe aegerita]
MWTLYEAVNLTPDGHPFKVNCLTWLGICTRNFFDVFRMVDGLDKAINAYKRAATSPSGEPALRYAAGMLWAHAARIRHGPSQQAIDAYSVALDLLPRIAWLGSDIASRHKELANKGDDAPKAAVAAIEMGEYGTALEWLEQGRSVVWGQLLQLRSPVDHLRSVNETLADELLRVSRELDGISTRQTQTSGSKRVKEDGPQSLEEVAQRHRRLAEEWEELLAELRKAAREGPVVFLNIHHLQCDALIIQSDQESDPILHVPFSSFSIKKAQELQLSLKRLLGLSGVQVRGGHQVKFLPGQQGPSFEKILSTLWMEIVKPVLDKLNYKQVSSSSTPTRIWWCATGPVAFLPLHAAGLYTTPQEGTKVFEYVTSSYTPTLTALLRDPLKKDSQFHGILAISQPTTPDQSPLPKTENEVESIRQHCISTGQPLEWLNKSEATISNILQGMTNHNWVHLACHAVQRVDAPTQSAFCLHQGRLELSEIIARCKSLPLAELAFLSACQTASGDEKLSEEAVHLAAGMMLAGYKSVVATMWSIRDRDAPLVADGVYRQLLCRPETGSTMREERPDSTRSAHALHCAVRELREVVGEKAFIAWVPFIHFGL